MAVAPPFANLPGRIKKVLHCKAIYGCCLYRRKRKGCWPQPAPPRTEQRHRSIRNQRQTRPRASEVEKGCSFKSHIGSVLPKARQENTALPRRASDRPIQSVLVSYCRSVYVNRHLRRLGAAPFHVPPRAARPADGVRIPLIFLKSSSYHELLAPRPVATGLGCIWPNVRRCGGAGDIWDRGGYQSEAGNR